MNTNLRIYDTARSVPAEAKKNISAGRLKGMTDINPMYRIKRLTEIFGPCGIGWWYEITDKRLVPDEKTNQVAAFVDILLFYVDPSTGEVSKGIPGTGGSSFVSQERNGPYLSDECFKMALTDSIGVAAKALGIGADVYWEKDKTKYSSNEADTSRVPTGIVCSDCGKEITASKSRKGETWSAADIAEYTMLRYGRQLCTDCMKQVEAAKAYAEREDG